LQARTGAAYDSFPQNCAVAGSINVSADLNSGQASHKWAHLGPCQMRKQA